jgi:hypothetical protein
MITQLLSRQTTQLAERLVDAWFYGEEGWNQ